MQQEPQRVILPHTCAILQASAAMTNDADILTVVRNELTMALAEDTPAEDLDRAARAVVAALHSEEFDLEFDGVRYRAQRSEKLRAEADGRMRVRVRYCRIGD